MHSRRAAAREPKPRFAPPPVRPEPPRLYRNPENGKLAGVCAGIADYFGLEPGLIRFCAIVGTLFFPVPVLPAYLILTLALPKRPRQPYRSPEEEDFWRQLHNQPKVTAEEVRTRYRDLGRRLANLETYVTTREFQLDRDIRNLDR